MKAKTGGSRPFASPALQDQRQRRATSKRVVFVILLIAGTLAGGGAWLRQDMRQVQWAEAGRVGGNLVLGLERDITRVIESYDLSLQATARALVLPGFDTLPPETRDALLYDSVARAVPNGVAVVDRLGKPVFSSDHRDYGTLEFSDRDWFKAQQDRADAGLFVSPPVVGRISRAQNVALSRRVNGRDGAFAGVVVTAIPAEFFQNLFSALKLGEGSSVTLLTMGGQVVARTPYDARSFGADVRGAEVFRLVAGAKTGTYEAPSVVDGIGRLYAYRQVGSLPFILTVGLSEREIFAPWNRTARVIGAVVVLVLVLAAGLALTLWREFRRRDRAERRARDTASQLNRADALLRTIMETAPSLIYAKDRRGRMLLANGSFLRFLGKSWAEVEGKTDAEFISDPAQAEAVLANDRRIMETGQVHAFEELVGLDGGQPRTWLSTKTPMRDLDGTTVGLVGVSIDITERKRIEERQRLMVNELNHRVKNTLATVQAIASQTLRGADPALGRTLEGRLLTLAAAHDVLTRESWEGAELDDVATGALDPFGGRNSGRFVVSGPRVRLEPRAALALALGLHELCTNALKYGALSAEQGYVVVYWEITRDAEPLLRLTWVEHGGPPVAVPARRGFGTRLVERSLAQDLGGTARIDFGDPEGIRCLIEVRLSEVAAPTGAPPFPQVGMETRVRV